MKYLVEQTDLFFEIRGRAISDYGHVTKIDLNTNTVHFSRSLWHHKQFGRQDKPVGDGILRTKLPFDYEQIRFTLVRDEEYHKLNIDQFNGTTWGDLYFYIKDQKKSRLKKLIQRLPKPRIRIQQWKITSITT